MSFMIISKQDMASFVSSAMEEYEIIGPIARADEFVFAPLTDARLLRLDYNTSILPPKKALLPQEETLFTFQRTGGFSTELVLDHQPRVLFGVHTCDIHALKLLDTVFTQGSVDVHYLRRRENAVVVGIECLTPCDEHSFCKSMGTLSASAGHDLHLTDIGEAYAVDVKTEAGAAVVSGHAHARAATPDDIKQLNKVLAEKWPRFTYKLKLDAQDLPALMAVNYKSSLWEELGNKCLGCGQCTLVCPTCYCFNVLDATGLKGERGERKRVWDSCQLDEFARVATGENFRKTRAERVRQRFFRKAKYLPDLYGALGCVGCGRCARACLVHITPVDVFNMLDGTKKK